MGDSPRPRWPTRCSTGLAAIGFLPVDISKGGCGGGRGMLGVSVIAPVIDPILTAATLRAPDERFALR